MIIYLFIYLFIDLFIYLLFCTKRHCVSTVDSHYLNFDYLELKTGSCFNMELLQQVTKYCGKEEKLLLPLFHNFFKISLIPEIKLYIRSLNVVV